MISLPSEARFEDQGIHIKPLIQESLSKASLNCVGLLSPNPPFLPVCKRGHLPSSLGQLRGERFRLLLPDQNPNSQPLSFFFPLLIAAHSSVTAASFLFGD